MRPSVSVPVTALSTFSSGRADGSPRRITLTACQTACALPGSGSAGEMRASLRDLPVELSNHWTFSFSGRTVRSGALVFHQPNRRRAVVHPGAGTMNPLDTPDVAFASVD